MGTKTMLAEYFPILLFIAVALAIGVATALVVTLVFERVFLVRLP